MSTTREYLERILDPKRGTPASDPSFDETGYQAPGTPAVDPDVARQIATNRHTRLEQTRRNVDLQGSFVVASGGTVATIDCGGPDPGDAWELKRLAAGPLDCTSGQVSNASTYIFATNYVSTGLLDLSAMAFIAGIDQFPAVSYFGTREVVIQHPKRFIIVVTGLTGPYQATAGGQAISLKMGAAALYGI